MICKFEIVASKIEIECIVQYHKTHLHVMKNRSVNKNSFFDYVAVMQCL